MNTRAATNSLPRQQAGAALLMMMLVVLVGMTAVLVSRLGTGTLKLDRDEKTRIALAEAREALLDYATVYADLNAGASARLPCPDIDASGPYADGEAHTGTCGPAGASVLGRLPWRTLGSATLRDAGSACFWYVVSGSWKDAGGDTVELINPDSNGLLQLVNVESGSLTAGLTPAERPVAMVFAANEPLPGQSRTAAAPGEQCSRSFDAAAYLDLDSVSGVNNATVSGVADAVDVFAVASGGIDTHNDRVAVISRADIQRRVAARHDFDARMRGLGLALTQCLAEYARHNSGGVNDRRLPWPAPLLLTDYRSAALYDDADAGSYSGRLPDVADESSAATGNSLGSILGACDPAAVPAWTAESSALWQNWKDHFFYAVADSHAPSSAVPSSCVDCLTVNGAGQYIAVVLFGNSRLQALAQGRNAPPVDGDERRDQRNYLEGGNETHFPFVGGTADFRSQTHSESFNDLLFCIDDSLNTTEC